MLEAKAAARSAFLLAIFWLGQYQKAAVNAIRYTALVLSFGE